MSALRRLRLSLTLLYLLASLALIALVGVGTYLLVDRYFQSSTDLTLRYKMATQLTGLGLPLTPELISADQQWRASRGLVPSSAPASTSGGEGDESHEDREREEHERDKTEPRVYYDGDLAAVFVLALDANGQPVTVTGTTGTAGTVSGSASDFSAPDAVTAALADGSDLRTVLGTGGLRARLLTYALPDSAPAGGGPVALQVGRTLTDQDRVLQQLLMGLLVLSGASALLLGLASWWLSGRSLKPAQEAWERQQAFVANASHELRAPLTLMRANAEVALRRAHAAQASVPALPGASSRAVDSEQRLLLQDMVQEVDHMSLLVDDLLLLSRLDAGQLQLQRQPLEAAELLEGVRRQVSALGEQRGVDVVVDGASGTIMGDPARLRQVLLILLDNALRHTPAGGKVALSARPDGHNVRLVVADTGEGIPPGHLPHVFERFYRASSERGEEAGGSGLGLSIARALVDAHHGHISISSAPGKGTTVEMMLPAA